MASRARHPLIAGPVFAVLRLPLLGLPLLALPLLALTLFPGAAHAETWHVGEHREIQEAIMSAAYGDTVLVAPGTYGRLVMQSGIKLIAEKGPSETILRNNSFWVVKADGVDSLATVEGFLIDGGKGAEGVIRCENSFLTIKDCEIHGGWSGIRALYCELRIENCTIRECQNGIYLFESDGVIRDNDIQLCITGITLVSAGPRIIRNRITRNTLGIRVAEHSEPTIGGSLASANRIWNNQSGGIKNEAYLKRQGLRTMKPMTLRVPYNFWGSDCPDTVGFQGDVVWAPWVDETGKRSIAACESE